MSQAADDANQQAQQANITMSQAADDANQQAQQANNTMSQAADDANQQAQQANNTMSQAADDANQQAQQANNTLSQAADDANQHAQQANDTLNSLAEAINNVIQDFSPSLEMFLQCLTPFKVLMGVKVCIDVFQSVGIIKNPVVNALTSINQSVDGHLKKIDDYISRKAAEEFVKVLMKKSEGPIFYGLGKQVEAYFFYTRFNQTAAMLQAQSYFAFDSIHLLFNHLYIWNVCFHHQKVPRKNIIWFIDEDIPPTNLSAEFTEIYQDVEIHAPSNSCRTVRFSKVKVHKGCSVKFSNLTVLHNCIDVRSGGNAHLYQCNVGWDPPRLYLDDTNIHQPVYPGKVSFLECELSSNIEKKSTLTLPFGRGGGQFLNPTQEKRLLKKYDWNQRQSYNTKEPVQITAEKERTCTDTREFRIPPRSRRFKGTLYNSYDGEWKNNKRHGKGLLKYYTGEEYDGDWKNNQRHGSGKHTCANGDVYSGEWKDGKRHGSGKHTCANGDVYSGEWKDGKRHGRGKIVYNGGNKANMIAQRLGTLSTTDTDFSSASTAMHPDAWSTTPISDMSDGGNKANMIAQRLGTLSTTDTDTSDNEDENSGEREDVNEVESYDGGWKNDQYHGKGTLKYANGNVHSGEWKNGKRHGKGTLKYANGAECEGVWADDKMVGEGNYHESDYAFGFDFNGVEYEGVWADDEQVGECILHEPHVLLGGKGTLKYADGVEYEGIWADDKKVIEGNYHEPHFWGCQGYDYRP
jgi:hypothetical protein